MTSRALLHGRTRGRTQPRTEPSNPESKARRLRKLQTPPGKPRTPRQTKHSAKEHEEQELEIEKRTEEINQEYLDRIAAIRTQISTAQQELAKLQRDQVESTNEFQRTLGSSPNIADVSGAATSIQRAD